MLEVVSFRVEDVVPVDFEAEDTVELAVFTLPVEDVVPVCCDVVSVDGLEVDPVMEELGALEVTECVAVEVRMVVVNVEAVVRRVVDVCTLEDEACEPVTAEPMVLLVDVALLLVMADSVVAEVKAVVLEHP